MAPTASTAVSQNRPDMPIKAYRIGAATMERANTSPMEEPIMAMTLVRCCSRVRSAARAVTAAEMAPAPWNTRPTSTVCTSWASAAMMLPITNSTSPNTITGLRPKRSDAAPKGICKKAWVRP